MPPRWRVPPSGVVVANEGEPLTEGRVVQMSVNVAKELKGSVIMHSTTYNQPGAKSVAQDFSDKAGDLATKAGNQIDKALEAAESKVRDLAERSGEAGEKVQEVAGNVKTAIDRSVHDQPMTTLAMAAAVGFVLGALWKS